MGEGGKIRGVYCHHDGYPSHVGALLLRYYNQPDSINKLIFLGSLDSLVAILTVSGAILPRLSTVIWVRFL